MGCGSSVEIALGVPTQDTKLPEDYQNGVQSNTKLKLTTKQMKLIKTTWKQLDTDFVKLGSKVFLRIFDLNTHIKALFPFKDIWGDNLLKNPLFKAHSNRFMDTIDQSITNLHMVDTTVGPQLYNLGKTHAVHVGFRPEYFLLYRSSMLYVFQQELGAEFTDETSEAWDELLNFVTTKLKEGYEKGQNEQEKQLIKSEK